MGGNPSGLGLMLIMMVMTVCSLSFVRRSGNFQVFYFSHLLYWCYYPIIILHAPNFWKYFIFFGAIFLAEKFFRTMSFIMGRGQTVIDEAVSLQSKVTYLKIRKLSKFNHSPGDWCFIKIPTIAKFEWHPFTISSAPEDPNHFTVHIRGVGHWTNKLYKHFRDIQECNKNRRNRRKSIVSVPINLEQPMTIMVDGPFGSPSSNIYRAEHAVLIGTGIGITPFASILQSIMHRHWNNKQTCPKCEYKWTKDSIDNLSVFRRWTSSGSTETKLEQGVHQAE